MYKRRPPHTVTGGHRTAPAETEEDLSECAADTNSHGHLRVSVPHQGLRECPLAGVPAVLPARRLLPPAPGGHPAHSLPPRRPILFHPLLRSDRPADAATALLL